MRKSEMIDSILSLVNKVENCEIRRVYGVSCGVGYDLDITISFNTGEVKMIEAHANNHGWYYPSHLRPNNPPYKYTGSCDRYQSRVISAWVNGLSFEYYLNKLNKNELQALYDEVIDGL